MTTLARTAVTSGRRVFTTFEPAVGTTSKALMQKNLAVATLGQRGLLMPTWLTAVLRANDRLKLYLTDLQAASSHALHPDHAVPDMAAEMSAAGLNDTWLHDLASEAKQVDEAMQLPDFPRIVKCLADGSRGAPTRSGIHTLARRHAGARARQRPRLRRCAAPLLLSVRSGARVSMPGMMETLLNVGLSDATVGGLLRQTGNSRLVRAAYRRLISTYGEVVAGLPPQLFDDALQAIAGTRD